MMKIVISGYGKMGKEIEKVALLKGHQIALIIDNEEGWKTHGSAIQNADVAIDFSLPETAVNNILRFFEAKMPVVIGTTGWNNRFEEIASICYQQKQAIFISSNFSIGVNILFALNIKMAKIMKGYPEYNVTIEETHHTQKLDSPSGTAITLANDIIKSNETKVKWVNEPTDFNNFLEIKSFREDNITGIHDVIYNSEIDTLEIKHTARNRSGFAYGAIMAAEWIQGKKGVFGMKNMLNTGC
jgi:4-hydroxy-tetrahydrodipicolinate reductase